MNPDLEKRIREAMLNPQNMGELAGADRTGTVGNSECGEMLRMWVKFKEENGRKVIDRATFQSFGCETAIAVASLATELIRGKTAEEALALKTEELAGELGPLPPMKIHCAQLVEGALRSALDPDHAETKPAVSPQPTASSAQPARQFPTQPKEGGSAPGVFGLKNPNEQNRRHRFGYHQFIGCHRGFRYSAGDCGYRGAAVDAVGGSFSRAGRGAGGGICGGAGARAQAGGDGLFGEAVHGAAGQRDFARGNARDLSGARRGCGTGRHRPAWPERGRRRKFPPKC